MSSGFNPSNTFKLRVHNLRSFWKDQEVSQKETQNSKSSKKSNQKSASNPTGGSNSLFFPPSKGSTTSKLPVKTVSSPAVPNSGNQNTNTIEVSIESKNQKNAKVTDEQNNYKELKIRDKNPRGEEKQKSNSKSPQIGNTLRISLSEEQEKIRKLYLSDSVVNSERRKSIRDEYPSTSITSKESPISLSSPSTITPSLNSSDLKTTVFQVGINKDSNNNNSITTDSPVNSSSNSIPFVSSAKPEDLTTINQIADTGLRIIDVAVAEDSKGNFKEAINQYENGLNCLLKALELLKRTSADKQRESSLAKLTDFYLKRAESVKVSIAKKKKANPDIYIPSAPDFSSPDKRFENTTNNNNINNINISPSITPSENINSSSPIQKTPPAIVASNNTTNTNDAFTSSNSNNNNNGADKRSFTIVWKNFFNPTAPVNTSNNSKAALTPLQGKKVKYGSFVQFLSSNNDKRQKKVELQIALLVGKTLSWMNTLTTSDEVAWFHHKMLRLRLNFYDEVTEMSQKLKDKKTANDKKQNDTYDKVKRRITFYNPTSKFSNKQLLTNIIITIYIDNSPRSVKVSGDFTPSLILTNELKIQNAEEYDLRIRHKVEVIDGDSPLVKSQYILNCLMNDKQIELDLIKKSDIEIEAGSKEDELMDEKMLEESIEDHPTQCIPLQEIKETVKIKVNYLEFTKSTVGDSFSSFLKTFPFLFISVALHHGEQALDEIKKFKVHQNKGYSNINANTSVEIMQVKETHAFSIQLCDLPLSTHIRIILYGSKSKDNDINKSFVIAFVKVNLFNHRNFLKTGELKLNMTNEENLKDEINQDIRLFIEIPDVSNGTGLPIEHPLFREYFSAPINSRGYESGQSKSSTSVPEINDTIIAELNRIITKDPIDELTSDEKDKIWEYRLRICGNPKALPKLLLSFNWRHSEKVEEAIRLMKRWEPLSPEQALELLSSKYADVRVREYAVKQLDSLRNNEFDYYIYFPQLLQALKSEFYHYSALACLLIRKALYDLRIAHITFWQLRSEMREPYTERYQLMMESFLLGCGYKVRELLIKQDTFIGYFTAIAKEVKESKPAEREFIFRREIDKVTSAIFTNTYFVIPIDPTAKLKKLIPSKCSFFESKTFPLLLTFEKENGEPYEVIYKVGDDLRKDSLVVQMINLMDKYWKESGIELSLTHYNIVSTGPASGLIEVVPNAFTVFKIQMEYGGATAAFSTKCILSWLEKNNPEKVKLEKAIETFKKSLAGYCVITYILGIGDRHNENIMITKDGKLFHIDFGKILGDRETFAGVNRDRAPFVFTKDFAYVIDSSGKACEKSPKIKEFIDLCCKAFNIIRANGHTLINLFSLMLSTGIPELQTPDDLQYLREALILEKTEEQATQYFTELIWKSLNTKSTALNFFVHNMAHRKKK